MFVSVSSDVSGAISGLTDVDQKVNGVSASMQAAAPAGYALAAAAAAVGAGFLSSVTVAADFEHQINGIKSVMSPTEVQEFGAAVQALALQLGKDTVFSASQAADAIQELIKAGVPLPAILDGAAASALDLASATGVPVTQAAQLASTAMNAFHESASALPGIMDTIANVSNATAISVSSLQFALAAVGPVANGVGLSFADTATALGIFANNGLVGSDAGTSLKTMLLNLEPNTKSSAAAFVQLGLVTADGANQFFDATGKAKSMRDIFEVLQTATAGLSDEQKIMALQTAFGTDAVRAATIAANEGAAGWDNVTAEMDKMGGTAVAAAQRNSGLAGAMNQLNGSIETIQITIGNYFLPILTQMVTGLTSILNGFLTLDPGIQVAITAVVGIAGAVAALAAGFILLGPVITSVVAAFGIIGGALAAVALPLAALVAVAALLYAAWQDDFGGIREVTEQVWQAIQPAFQNIVNFIGTIRDTLAPMFSSAQSAAGPFIEQMSGALAPILAQLPGAVKAFGDELNKLGTFFGIVADSIRFLVGGDFSAFERLLENTDAPIGFVQVLAQLRTAFDAIGPVVEMVAQAINFLITGNLDRLYELMGEGLPPQFAAALQFIHDVLAVQIQVWKDILGGIVEFVGYLSSGDLQGAWNSILNTVGKLRDDILPLWNEFLTVLGNLLQGLPGFIGQQSQNMWQYLLGVFSSLPGLAQQLWEGIKTSLGGLMSELPGALATAAGAIWQYLLGVFSTLPGLAQPLWNTILDNLGGLMTQLPGSLATAAGNIWEYLLGIFSSLPGLAQGLWGTILENLGGLMTQIPGALATAAGNIWEYVLGVFSSLPGLAQDLWGTILDNLGGLMTQIPGALATAAGNIWQYVLGTFSSLPGLAQDLWGTILDNLGGLMGQLPGSLVTAAGDIWQYVVGVFSSLPGLINDIWPGILSNLGGLLGQLPGALITAAGDIFGGVVQQATDLVGRIATALDPLRQLLANTLGNIGSWVASGTTSVPSAGGGGTGGFGGEPVPTTGGTGPLITIGTVNISNEAELQNFIDLMAAAILGSAIRVTPPTGGVNPVLG